MEEQGQAMPIHVIFISQGDICRAPMAEGVFTHLVREAGLEDQITVDSCGTDRWHLGQRTHRKARRVLEEHGISYRRWARRIKKTDLDKADYLIVMDSSNLARIKKLGQRAGGTDTGVELLLTYAPEVGLSNVPDPYYTGEFLESYRLVEAGCRGLLAYIREKHGI
jgi:protein-tyrosine phosphatase